MNMAKLGRPEWLQDENSIEVILFEVDWQYAVVLSYCNIMLEIGPPWLYLAHWNSSAGYYWQCSHWFKTVEQFLEMIWRNYDQYMYDKCYKLFNSPPIRMLLLTLDLQKGEDWA